MAISTKTKEYIALEYAKYFGRTADKGIIDYYGSIGKTSKILNQIIKDADIEKYSVHGDDLQAEVHNVFQNLFSRKADNKELQKYVKVLQKGKNLPINSIVKKATKFDKDVYENKKAIAEYVYKNGGGVFDLSKVTKANPIDVKSLTSLTDLQTKIDALPENSNVPSTFDGETYILTEGVDSGKKFVGTAKNDLFTADDTVAAKVVTSLADSLDGGKGEDTFLVYGTPNAIPTLKNIENVIVDNMANNGTANFSTQTGIKSATVKNAVGISTITVADGVSVTLEKNANAATAQTVNYSATQTTANLTLNKVITNTTVKVDVNGADVTTLNIATEGSASSVGELDVDAKMATVVITGDKNLTVIDALEDTIDTLDASAFKGDLNVKFADATDAGGANDAVDLTVKSGSGNDKIDISTLDATDEVAVNTGAGNDTVVIKTGIAYAAATATSAGAVIVGGEGKDTLSIDGNVQASDISGVFSGFEVLEFTADANSTNMTVNKLGINEFLLTGNVDVTLTGLSNNAIATITGTTGSDLTATIGTNGTADVITVNLESAGSTTKSIVTLTNYETLNLVSTKSSTDAATVTNTLDIVDTAPALTSLVVTGTQDLTIGSSTLKADAAVDASALTGKLNATFASALKSFKGSSTAENKLSLVAGNLKQGATFTAGSATTDAITVAATAAQDMGILALTGFETLNLTTSGANAMDLRNVTGLNTIAVNASTVADTLVISRMNSETVLKFGLAAGNIASVTTTVASGTTQSVTMAGANDVTLLNLDSGTTKLKLAFDDGDATAGETLGDIATITGTSLATIEVSGKDNANLGTIAAATVTTIDASALTGDLTVTASTTGTTITGGAGDDAITGGNGDDVIRGGKGDDTIVASTGSNTIIFEANGADNGLDTITLTAANDKLNFKNFISSLSVDKNGGAGTAITAYDTSSVSDVNITNKIALYSDASYGGVATTATIAALIQGTGDAFSLTAGGKAILITGDAAGANDVNQLWYIDDSLDGVSGNISAADVVSVGVTSGNFDLDTLNTNNFVIA